MSEVIQMKCKTCDTPIDKDTGTEEGYCLVCVEKTNQLLQVLDRMIPYGTESERSEEP